MQSSVSAVGLSVRSGATRAVVASCLGNVLEWYDFIVFTTFAVQISHAFFPGKSNFTSLMAALITFGVGFLARPFGAAFFGEYADKAGRRAALTLTFLLMALGTLLIAICPTTAMIGAAAPIILVLARLIQGISAGGEIGGALALLVEYAPASRRAFYSAFQQSAQGGTLLLCGLIATILNFTFSESQVNEWAWRIPFLLGIVIAPVGFYIRRQVKEPDLFVNQTRTREPRKPLRSLLVERWKSLVLGIGVGVVATVSIYVVLYIPTFAHELLNVPRSDGYISLMIVGLIAMLCPLSGILADRFSRKSVMLFGAGCFMIYPYPAFRYLVSHPTGGSLIAVQLGLAIILVIYSGPISAWLAELFPTKVRSTGIALAYGLSVTIFGGFTPAIIAALTNYTGSKLAVAFWLMLSAFVSTISLLAGPDRSRQALT
jgi:MHS family proline/betaine transporter-like MFS transporter